MKKIFLLIGLTVFVTVCFIGGCYTNGLVQHLLFLGPAIAVLKVACGKEQDNNSSNIQSNLSKSLTNPTQPEFEIESNAVVNGI